jgi:hypothetical protein
VKRVKRSFALMILTSFLLVFSYGCASKDYVRQQIEPLVDRINKLEASRGAPAAASDCCEKAQAAAEKAEAAAKKAEAAATKAGKAFELQQKK